MKLDVFKDNENSYNCPFCAVELDSSNYTLLAAVIHFFYITPQNDYNKFGGISEQDSIT